MSLSQRNVLLYSDDNSVFDFISITLKPLVKNLVTAKNTAEVMKKIENQVFDCVVFKTKGPTLSDQAGALRGIAIPPPVVGLLHRASRTENCFSGGRGSHRQAGRQ